MIVIDTKNYDPIEVRDVFLKGLTKVVLVGMSVDSSETSEHYPKAPEYTTQNLPTDISDGKIIFGREDDPLCAQDYAESIAWVIFNKNSYSDNFGSAEPVLEDAAQHTLDLFPSLEINGEIYLDMEWSNMLAIIILLFNNTL